MDEGNVNKIPYSRYSSILSTALNPDHAIVCCITPYIIRIAPFLAKISTRKKSASHFQPTARIRP